MSDCILDKHICLVAEGYLENQRALVHANAEHKYDFANDDDCMNVKKRITELLYDTKTRLEGVLLLEYAFKRNAVYSFCTWREVVVLSMECGDNKFVLEAALLAFNQKLVNLAKADEKDLIADIMSKLVPVIFKMNLNMLMPSLQTLKLCMELAPNAINNDLVEQIENFLYQHMAVSVEVSMALGECFAYLPNCLAENNQNRYVKEWHNVFTKLLKTTSSVLKSLNYFEESEDDEHARLFKISDVNNPYVHYGICIYKSLCICMAQMLSSGCRKYFMVPVATVLDFVTQIFSIATIRTNWGDVSGSYFFFGYLDLITGVYIVLEALVKSVTSLLYFKKIFDLVKESLDIIQHLKYSPTKILQTRTIAWKFLLCFFECSESQGIYAFLPNFYLFHDLIDDVLMEQNDVVPVESVMDEYVKAVTPCCAEALKVLDHVVVYGAEFLPEIRKKFLLTKMAEVLGNVQSKSDARFWDFPYQDQTCRQRLYMVFTHLTLFIEYNDQYMELALGILSNAAKDLSPEVAFACSVAFELLKVKTYKVKPKCNASLEALNLQDLDVKDLMVFPNRRREQDLEQHSAEIIDNIIEENLAELKQNIVDFQEECQLELNNATKFQAVCQSNILQRRLSSNSEIDRDAYLRSLMRDLIKIPPDNVVEETGNEGVGSETSHGEEPKTQMKYSGVEESVIVEDTGLENDAGESLEHPEEDSDVGFDPNLNPFDYITLEEFENELRLLNITADCFRSSKNGETVLYKKKDE